MIRNPESVDRNEFKNVKKQLKKHNVDIEQLFNEVRNQIELEKQEEEEARRAAQNAREVSEPDAPGSASGHSLDLPDEQQDEKNKNVGQLGQPEGARKAVIEQEQQPGRQAISTQIRREANGADMGNGESPDAMENYLDGEMPVTDNEGNAQDGKETPQAFVLQRPNSKLSETGGKGRAALQGRLEGARDEGPKLDRKVTTKKNMDMGLYNLHG